MRCEPLRASALLLAAASLFHAKPAAASELLPPDAPAVAQAMQASARFSGQLQQRRWQDARAALGLQGLPPEVAEEARSVYLQYAEGVDAVGIRLLRDEIRSVRVYAEPEGYVALIDLDSIYQHPLAASGQVSEPQLRLAFSRDGRAWQIAPPTCSAEAQVRQVYPRFDGIVPALRTVAP